MNDGENFDIAVHEAAHAVAADFYDVPNFPELTPGGFSKVKQSTDPGTAGLCHLERTFTKYQDAVISWAGILGQCMFASAPNWAPPFRPSEKLLKDFFMMTFHQRDRFSDTDRLGILADYRHTWRACKSAFNIVRRDRSRIIRLARVIAGRNATPPVPMPDRFPATLGDFLRLVVTGDDAETKFAALVRAQSEKFFAGGQFAFEPEQHRQAVESWTAARMEHWRVFKNAEDWTGMARAFKAWTKTATKPATP